jgi:hypothetical protein
VRRISPVFEASIADAPDSFTRLLRRRLLGDDQAADLRVRCGWDNSLGLQVGLRMIGPTIDDLLGIDIPNPRERGLRWAWTRGPPVAPGAESAA